MNTRGVDIILGLTGVVFPFAGATAPAGWLLCDGSAVSRETYANLFAVIGTAYGAGDGSTTFNLPDLRGRVAAGKDDMGGSAANRLTTGGSGVDGATLGAAGGAQTHTLSEAQMPAHGHTGTAASNGSHTHTGSANTAGDHTHTYTGVSGGDTGPNPIPGANAGSSNTGSAGSHSHTLTINADGAHTHSVTVGDTGGGSAHNNTQPTIVLNHIIRT